MLFDRRLFMMSLACVMAASGPAIAQTLGEVETRANVEYGRHDGEALLGDLWAPKAAGKYPAIWPSSGITIC